MIVLCEVNRCSKSASSPSKSKRPDEWQQPVCIELDIGHIVTCHQHVRPKRLLYSAMKLRIRRCIVTSRPIVGSSRKTTCGRCKRAAAISHFILSPRERLRTGFCQQRTQFQQVRQFFQDTLIIIGGIGRSPCLIQMNGSPEYPNQLVALTHHQSDLAQESFLPFPWYVPQHSHGTARGYKSPESIFNVWFYRPFDQKATISPGAMLNDISSTACTASSYGGKYMKQ